MKIGNWPLLLLAIEHAIKHPDEYDQSIWRRRRLMCATTRCVAGWIAWFAGWRDTSDDNPNDYALGVFLVEKDHEVETVESAALRSLEIDPELNATQREDLTNSLFCGSLDLTDVLAAVRDLAKADGVIPTPLIIEEMLRLGVISAWEDF